MPRTIAIGDIHGCSKALAALLKAIAPVTGDTLVMLGDYIDRGPDSCGVIEQLMALQQRCRLVMLRGNHEQMMLDATRDPQTLQRWHLNGGSATLRSYDARSLDDIPSEHLAFIHATRLFHETDAYLFVHANYDENKSLDEQDPEVLLWRSLNDHMPGPHVSGKTAIVGHTIMYDDPLDLGHLICLDTGCFAGSRLTAMDLSSRQIWQSDIEGRML